MNDRAGRQKTTLRLAVKRSALHLHLTLLCIAGCGQPCSVGHPEMEQEDPIVSPVVNDDIENLIDQLVQVSTPGLGYSEVLSGADFQPYDESAEINMAVLAATDTARSVILKRIIEQGVAAVPDLLRHMSDGRTINVTPMSGMMWMDFSDEYDFNRRLRESAPSGVNRTTFGSNERHPRSHSLTVGDLCFVALGQIVNRRFSAVRYQPTGGLVVSSPTYSKRLRDVVIRDWTGLTSETHKQLLIEDFIEPDFERRRIGAYLRLSFYYPETVEALVLSELYEPTFDIFKVDRFCRDSLYTTDVKKERQQLYDGFLREHGHEYSAGVMRHLVQDLGHVPHARELLTQLFGESAALTRFEDPYAIAGTIGTAETERATLIRSLTHDTSKRIGDAVKELFLERSEDVYMASACLKCLADRGYESFLIEQLQKIDFTATTSNTLHLSFVEAISSSRETNVQNQLREVIKTTRNPEYFMAALAGLEKSDDQLILDRSTRILDGLPRNTDQGHALLQMIGNRFPENARDIFQSFLSKRSTQRAETMCSVLWHGSVYATEVLEPLLDDKRKLDGFDIPMRVCDRAAEAISHATDRIGFDSQWSLARRDRAILELKQFCAKAK